MIVKTPRRRMPRAIMPPAAVEYKGLVICDPQVCEQLIKKRQERGLDSFDEVWDGVYVMSPIANDEHQEVVGVFYAILHIVIAWTGLGKVRPGVNVSNRDEGWTENYRVPEVVVYLPENPALNRNTHWVGGPDFGIEVVSEGDRSRQKFDFYAKVGARELLIVDRYPWALELYALKRKKMRLVGRSTPEDGKWLQSGVIPLAFRLIPGDPRPIIEVRHADTDQTWRV